MKHKPWHTEDLSSDFWCSDTSGDKDVEDDDVVQS